MTKYAAIDFEFFNSNEEVMNVVACVIITNEEEYRIDCTNPQDVNVLKQVLDKLRQDNVVIVSYAAIAEARAMLSLGIDPLQFQWIDLYVEFIMLCNSNNRYSYGNYLGPDGSVRYSTPPDPTLSEEEKEEDTADHSETPKNLLNCAYKMLKVRLDAEEKDAMRSLILSKDLLAIHNNMSAILEYCSSDTRYLLPIKDAIDKALKAEGVQDFEKDQLSRGRYAVSVAKSEALGIPININPLNKVIEKTSDILKVSEREVNEYFNYFVPEYQKPPKTLKNGNTRHYKPTPAKKDTASYQAYVASLKIEDFPRTKTGKFKSDKDTLEEWGYWQGLEALWKYNRLDSSLKWFKKDNKNGFFERLGSDQNVRPYYGIFGTQTGRNAAKAKAFPLAMSSWIRAIVSPKTAVQKATLRPSLGESARPDYIVGLDFSQQEVYVAAILSGDPNLLQAYNSGDVYLEFAKQSGMVPATATKTTHKAERNICKATVLGLQYGMGVKKLRTKLRLDTGRDFSLEETQALVDAHKNVFSVYWEWVKELTNGYKMGNPLVTNDGWILFSDNPVITSVRNFPVQGNSASITRLAVVRAWEAGLKVMCSLHDAIYIITENPERDEKILSKIMIDATADILKQLRDKCTMRVDGKTISSDEIWVEEKGEEDWNKFKEYLL